MAERPWTGNCHRCGKASLSSIMSMFNHDLICVACKTAERQRSGYKLAEAPDLEAHASRMEEVGCLPPQVDSVREAAWKLREGKL